MITEQRWAAAFLEAMSPIAHLLEDPTITNVMLNPPNRGETCGRVFVKTVNGNFVRTDLTIEADVAVKMLRRAVDPSERILLNEANPELSCRAGIYRLEGSIEPIVTGAAFTIRKHTHSRRSLDDYIAESVIAESQAQWVREQIHCGATILVGGPTDSGKTTLLNALVQVAAESGKRILTIEDTEELMRPNELAYQLFTNDDFSTRDAVKAAMRHNPQRIVVGEVRDGAAALEALKAWRTGHPGLATLHAGSCEEMLERVHDLCEEERRTRPRMVARTINVCVHIEASPRGPRVVTIEQVKGFDSNTERFLLHRIGGEP